MKIYTLKVKRSTCGDKIEVRKRGRIICYVDFHSWFSLASWSNSYIIQLWSESAAIFWDSLSSKMQRHVKSLLSRESFWNDEVFTIYTK